jgi:peptidoglycan hydrolase-like protein with peptidoglycan-binding domain
VREALARSDRDFLLTEPADDGPSRIVSALHLFLRRPVEVAGTLTMGAMTGAILVNALVMQTGSHPAPFFARQAAEQAALLRSRPQTVPARQSAEIVAASPQEVPLVRELQIELSSRGLYEGAADGMLGPKTDAAIRSFQQDAGLDVDGTPSEDLLSRMKSAPRPAAKEDPIATFLASNPPVPPAKRLLAVERALASLGYGPLKVDGLMDADTKGAIERFEGDRALPVTGRVSPSLIRELKAISGIPLE